jgi:phage repressor protein C with HTH and peptisase S24 domain
MSPALSDGDFVLTTKPRRLAPGLIYVINHSDLGRIIKRLDHIEGDRLILSGDNPGSTPSSIIAPVSKDRVIGRAVLAISKTGLRLL